MMFTDTLLRDGMTCSMEAEGALKKLFREGTSRRRYCKFWHMRDHVLTFLLDTIRVRRYLLSHPLRVLRWVWGLRDGFRKTGGQRVLRCLLDRFKVGDDVALPLGIGPKNIIQDFLLHLRGKGLEVF